MEFAAAVRDCLGEVPDKVLGKMYEVVDTDNSGTVSIREYLDFLHKMEKVRDNEVIQSRESLKRHLLKIHAGEEDYMPMIEIETRNAHIFQWNSTTEGANEVYANLKSLGVGHGKNAFGVLSLLQVWLCVQV